MKAYGYSRRDVLSCPYGCCRFKGHRGSPNRHIIDRANRKSARQHDKRIVYVELQ